MATARESPPPTRKRTSQEMFLKSRLSRIPLPRKNDGRYQGDGPRGHAVKIFSQPQDNGQEKYNHDGNGLEVETDVEIRPGGYADFGGRVLKKKQAPEY